MTAPADALAQRLEAALGPGYRVERAIGQGGFATVYLVRDLTLKRQLAVKVLSPDLLASATAQERFRREAETIAQLSHPNIVPLHFVGGAGDVFYLAMAYVDGESLADRIAREGRISPVETARILREVASALDLAHRRGVIHRDIKPHNVLLERETGRPLLTDFGIARTADGASLTATGVAVGTPAYMSPEQVTGGSVDHRADLYALGVVGYEMLTGNTPFPGATPAETLMKRVAQPAEPVEKARTGIPSSLATVINRCLDRDPDKRFASAGDVVRALGGTVATPISGARISVLIGRGARRSRRPVWLGVGLVIALAVGAGLLARRRPAARAPRPAAPQAPSTPPGMVLIPAGTYTIGRDDGAAWTRPAHRVALAAFYMDRTEVTLAEYRRFAANAGLWVPPSRAPGDSLLPATGVQWREAMTFCAMRRFPRGRLPTEEEWEAAARGAGATRYPWGSTWVPGAANTASARLVGPAPVGTFPRGESPSGVSDLVGNVWEWTSSPARAYPGGSAPPRSRSSDYVIRGGAWNTPDSLADASYRGYQPVADPAKTNRADLAATGFRCVVPVPATR